MSEISPQLAGQKLIAEQGKICFVDVRSLDEYKSGHIPGSICIPVDAIDKDHSLVPRDKLVILNCQSGMRSARAKILLQKMGYENLMELSGGFSAWKMAGLPVSKNRQAIPIMRQVLIIAGSFSLLGSVLALTVNFKFIFVPMFFGAGLTFAGITGWCGMALLLEKMPWNRT